MDNTSTYRDVDLSSFQSDLRGGSILTNAGVRFAILKVTEGRTLKDASFASHYAMCKAAGISVGAYAFSHSQSAEGGTAEAKFVIKTLKSCNVTSLELPVFIDIEGDILSGGSSALMASALAFGKVIQASGLKWGVYASLSRYGSLLNADTLRQAGAYIWCAAYNNSGPGMQCDIWQRSDSWKINDYPSGLDADILYNMDLIDNTSSIIEGAVPIVDSTLPVERSICSVTFPEMYFNATGEAVRAMQTLLILRGFSCGRWGADGDFGSATLSALRDFQRSKRLDADGICGALTWATLIGGIG